MENAVTPRNVLELGKNTNGSNGSDFMKCEENIKKIRKNLFELKLRYFQEKQENAIKS